MRWLASCHVNTEGGAPARNGRQDVSQQTQPEFQKGPRGASLTDKFGGSASFNDSGLLYALLRLFSAKICRPALGRGDDMVFKSSFRHLLSHPLHGSQHRRML